jgi:predicted ATPase
VKEARSLGLAQSVAEYLARKEILLIFDNFEHLQSAADFLSMLLASAPGLRLLVTSRACLHLYGEHEYVIPPMPVPNANDLAGASEAAAVRLFCDRAQAARADFALTPALLPVIVEICRRLDGLPLAIELAAARIKLFSPQELLQRLERRLPLLTQGPTGQAPRAQALENAIAWSYGLLSPSERALLNRLAVFVAGFTLPAVEAVCIFPFTEQIFSTGSQAALPMPGAVDGLAALLNQSLLLRQEIGGVIATESRFRMLETIQEFALERLRASSELELVLQRHAEYFAAWAEQAETHLYGPDQAAWLTRMEHDADNLRSALTRLLTAGQIEMAARMARALGVFWRRHGHYSEGRKLLEQVLSPAASTRLPDILRARALQSAGSLAYHQGDWPTAKGWLEESLALFRSCADRSGIARVLFDLGWIAIDQGDWQDAVRLNQGSLALAREVGDPWATYRALTNLGWTQLCTGDQETAAQFFQEAHQLAECVGHTKGVAVSLANLSWIALYQGDILRTVALATESLRLCHLLGEKEVIAECLEILAIAAVEERDVERGARLSGAAQALWDALHVTRSPAQHSAAAHAAAVATMRQQLPEAVLASFWLQGQAMGLDSIAAFVSDRG